MKKIAIVLLTVILSGVLGILPGVMAFAAAPVISDISVSGITENTAVISWTTDVDSTGDVDYGTAIGGPYPSTAVSPGAEKTHLANLTGLTADTTYYYVINATNGGDTTTSTEGSFTTKAFTVSGVSSSSITENSATITWNTNLLTTSNVQYGLTTAYGSISPDPADTTEDSVAHSVVLSGLTPDTLYHYKVVSINSGDTEESVDYTFQTLDSTAPVISNVQPTAVIPTLTSATITWDTDQAANSQVEYGTASATHGTYTTTTTLDATLVANHSVLLGGLTQDTLYYYRVISANTYGDEAVSAEYSFTTTADTTQPVISGTASGSITTTSATITWTTDENADSMVDYGTTVAYGSSKTSAALVTSHQIILTGLTPGTTYHFRVRSTDAYTNEAISADFTFDTLDDTTAPVISNVLPNDQVVAIEGIATITWDTDEAANSQVSWGIAAGELNTTTTLDSAMVVNHSVAIPGLSDGTTYYFTVKSLDASGNPAQSAVINFAALNAPTSVTKTTASSDNTPTFTWDAITGVTTFQVSIDGGAWTDVDAVTYTLGAAVADGAHTFEIRAIDSFDDLGDITLLDFTIDATAPAAVTGLTRTSAGNVNAPQFSWTAATDAGAGVSYYQIKIGDGEWIDIANVVTHTWATALVDEGAYILSVRAIDAAGNFGTPATLDFVVDTVVPTVPANVAITTGGSDTTPTFTWDAATDVTAGVASYEVRIGTGAFVDVGNVITYTVADGDALVAGSYIFEVRTVDGASNRSTVSSLAFTISKGGLPVWAIILIVIGAAAGAAGVFFWMRRSKMTPDKPDQKPADKTGKKTPDKSDKNPTEKSDQKTSDKSGKKTTKRLIETFKKPDRKTSDESAQKAPGELDQKMLDESDQVPDEPDQNNK